MDPITNDAEYSLSEETNNNIGIKVINNFGENLAYSFSVANDDFSGSSFSLGFRYNF